MTKRNLCGMLALIVIVMFSQIWAQAPANVDQILSQVATYDWGQSREPLTQWTELEQAAYKDPAALRPLEKKLAALLKTNAPLAARQFVCQRLSIIGTAASVPVLADMLKNEQTADMARYALERIPGEEVNAALLKALNKSTGLVGIGIINTLGQRGAAKAVPVLSKLLPSPDPALGAACAAALGKIGDAASLQALQTNIAKAKGEVLSVSLDAALKCADKLAAAGKQAEALAVYQKYQSAEYPEPVRAAALRGQLLADKAAGNALLLSTLQSGDDVAKSMAITLVRQLPGNTSMTPFAGQLNTLSAALKVQLLAALADRGDMSVATAVEKAAEDEQPAVRIAALRALSKLGSVGTVPLLVKVAAKTTEDEKKAAQEALYLISGQGVDAAVLQGITTSSGAEKIEYIAAAGERNIVTATPTLLTMAKDATGQVRITAFKVLGQIASAEDLSAMIDLLTMVKTETEQNEALAAVSAVSQKINDPAKRAEPVLSKLAGAKDEMARIGLLRVLGRIGAAPGLPVLRAALKDKGEEIQIAAVRALSDWPNSDPMSDLQELARTGATPRHQVLALRGFIRLIKQGNDRPETETLSLYQNAMALAKEDAEKKTILSGLGDLGSLDALNTAASALAVSGIQDEAGAATLSISRRLTKTNPVEVKAALEKAASVIQNANLKNDIQSQLSRLK
jgi:HEAT repeat protein